MDLETALRRLRPGRATDAVLRHAPYSVLAVPLGNAASALDAAVV